MRKSKIFSLVASLLSLPACALYQAPAGVPDLELSAPVIEPLEGPAIESANWWAQFDDKVLDALVGEALVHNAEIQVALANVNAARELQGLERWGYLPTGGAGITAERARGGSDATQESITAGIGTAWELDLFGRVRNSNRIAEANRHGAEALLGAARLLVVSETAATYFRYRAAEQKEVTRQQAVEQQRRIVSITQALVEESRSSADQLDRARAELATDEVALLRIQEERNAFENRLAVLLGRQPGHWQVPAATEQARLRFRPANLENLAGMLQNRPDVRSAEKALVARQAAAGIERASYFPAVGVSGFVGFTAGSFGELGDTSSEAWSVMPSVRWNLLDFGRTARRVAASEARIEAAAATYEKTVLAAIEETDNAFLRYRNAQLELLLRERARVHALAAAAAADARHEEGFGSYLDALLARRDAIAADIARADAIADQRLSTIALFAVVGAAP